MARHRIAILGSTGSIGRQALEVVAHHRDKLCIVALAAHSNVKLLLKQIGEFRPTHVCAYEREAAGRLRDALSDEPVSVHEGMNGLVKLSQLPEVDTVLVAVSGSVGLLPTLQALSAGKRVALANKEALVAGGHLVIEKWRTGTGELMPVDSEHSALFQCLLGEQHDAIKRLLLTASGGPFRTKSRAELERVTVAEALAHPTWHMGAKVTIDSATLMNKGLEIIEARWLFDVPPERIDVIVHPQSIIHSMVEFIDGSIKAQLSLPDMKLPIQFALLYPERYPSVVGECDLTRVAMLTFEPPDMERFPCLQLAREAAIQGGTLPAVMNAANEVAVYAFLHEQIGFMDIPHLIERVMDAHESITTPSLDDILMVDAWAREYAQACIAKMRAVSQ